MVYSNFKYFSGVEICEFINNRDGTFFLVLIKLILYVFAQGMKTDYKIEKHLVMLVMLGKNTIKYCNKFWNQATMKDLDEGTEHIESSQQIQPLKEQKECLKIIFIHCVNIF